MTIRRQAKCDCAFCRGRIPIHNHSGFNEGGKLDAPSVLAATGVTTSTGGGGAGDPHDLALNDLTDVNVPAPSDGDVPTYDAASGQWIAAPGGGTPDASDVSVTDAGGYYAGTDVEAVLEEIPGLFVTRIAGGHETIKAHGTTGSTEPIDPADGNVHTMTLDASCTATIAAPSGSDASTMELWVTQNGTGGWVLTLAATGGSVTWEGSSSHTTVAGETFRVVLERIPATTNDWIANLVGSADTAAGVSADTTGYAHSAGATVQDVLDDFDAAITAAAASGGSSSVGHAHVVSETHLSNGSATTYTLDQWFEPGSVIAWNTTTLARLDVTEAVPDQATVSAAGSSGDKIVFDYAATLA